MPIEVKCAAAREMKHRKRVKIIVIATPNDRSLSVFRHDERQRRGVDFSGVDRDAVFGCHVQKHATKPIIGESREHVRRMSQLRTAKGRGDRIAAERNCVSRGYILLVTGRHVIGQKRDVDVGLSNEEGLHRLTPFAQEAW